LFQDSTALCSGLTRAIHLRDRSLCLISRVTGHVVLVGIYLSGNGVNQDLESGDRFSASIVRELP